MGDERSNSAKSACGVGKRGTRSRGVDRAVELARLYPGIDGATMGWVQMGGKLENRNGMYHVVDPDGFANFLFAGKLSTRAKEAVARTKGGQSLLVECAQSVSRSVKATGYRVNGGGAFPDRRLPNRERPVLHKVTPDKDPDLGYGKIQREDDGRGSVVGMPADIKSLMGED